MIWLLAHPLHPPLPSVSWTGDTEKERQLADGRGGKGLGNKPNHTTARKPGPLQFIQYSLGGTHAEGKGGQPQIKVSNFSHISLLLSPHERGGPPFHLMKFLGTGGRGRVGEVMLKGGGVSGAMWE
jgi:hypothetical protein